MAWIVSVPPGAFVAVHEATPLLIVASHKKVLPAEKLTSGEVPVGLGPVDAVTSMVYMTWSPYVTVCGLALAVAVVLIAAPAGAASSAMAAAVITTTAAVAPSSRRLTPRVAKPSSIRNLAFRNPRWTFVILPQENARDLTSCRSLLRERRRRPGGAPHAWQARSTAGSPERPRRSERAGTAPGRRPG